MALKNERILYVARNFSTGLADVTAIIRRNGVSVATGVALSEIGSGEYQLLLTPALLVGYGGAGYYDFWIDSASKSAPAPAARWILVNDNDDIEIHLVTIESKIDTIDTEVGLIQTDLTSVKATVEDSNTVINDPSIGNANIKSIMDSINSIVTNISNVVRFHAAVLPQLIRKGAGNKTYKVPVFIYDNAGNMEDPDNNEVQLSITNNAGTVRDSLITGFTVQPEYITKIATGHYEFELTIPDTAAIEPLNLKFNYVEATIPLVQLATSEIVLDAQASGFALETTAQVILTDTADIQPKVVTMLGILEDALIGNANLKALLDTIDGNTDGIESEITDLVYGLPALRTQLDLKASQSSINNLQSDMTEVKGSTFVEATDALDAISERVYNGGRAV